MRTILFTVLFLVAIFSSAFCQTFSPNGGFFDNPLMLPNMGGLISQKLQQNMLEAGQTIYFEPSNPDFRWLFDNNPPDSDSPAPPPEDVPTDPEIATIKSAEPLAVGLNILGLFGAPRPVVDRGASNPATARC